MKIEEFEGRITDIPTLPMVASEINREAMKDNFTAKSMSRIIQKDPPMTGKLLRIANSAYYGFVRKITTLERALPLLGFNTVKNLALTVSVSHFFSRDKVKVIDMPGLWHHSLACAVAAKCLMSLQDKQLEEEAFLCGIIHDIGIIVLTNSFADQMVKVVSLIKEEGLAQMDAEKKVFGLTHAEVGAYLANKWNFPEKYYRVIRLHHKPPIATMDVAEPDNLLLLSVYAANQLAKVDGLGMSVDPKSSGVDPATWAAFGLTMKDLPEFRSTIKKAFDDVVSAWEE